MGLTRAGEGLVDLPEDQPVFGQAGYRENAMDLIGGPVNRDPFPIGRHLAMSMDYDGNGGGVEEFTALKPNQDLVVFGRSLEGLSQLVGYREVDLALDLDFVAPRLNAFLNELKGAHLGCRI